MSGREILVQALRSVVRPQLNELTSEIPGRADVLCPAVHGRNGPNNGSRLAVVLHDQPQIKYTLRILPCAEGAAGNAIHIPGCEQ